MPSAAVGARITVTGSILELSTENWPDFHPASGVQRLRKAAALIACVGEAFVTTAPRGDVAELPGRLRCPDVVTYLLVV